MEVSNFITIILFVISCVSILISIITFVKNGNKDIKQDTSKDSYKWRTIRWKTKQFRETSK